MTPSPNDPELRRTLRILEDWATDEELRDVLRRMSAKDLVLLLDVFGSAREAIQFLNSAKALVGEWTWRAEARKKIKTWLTTIALVGAAVSAVQGIILLAVLSWLK